ncbi:MAG: glycosyltransferase [Actinomycetota bacterium]
MYDGGFGGYPPGMLIHQVLVAAAPGDAITNEAREIRQRLRMAGTRSKIFARYIDPALSDTVLPIDRYPEVAGADDAALLYHASIGEEAVTRFLLDRPEPLALLYHNMSPAEPFARYDPAFAGKLTAGRRELVALRDRVSLSLADSAFNAADLATMGYEGTLVAPLIVDASRLLAVPLHAETVEWQSKVPGPVMLFVGQLLPHKQPHVLLQAYHALVTYLLPEAHLFLVGAPRLPRYKECLQMFIQEMNLTKCGIIKSPVTENELAAYYRRADAVVTFSEHEGFCVPLLEAMAFGKPILARAAGAVPETLGDAGLLIGERDGTMVAAEAMYEILTNEALRQRFVERGAARLEQFRPDRSWATMERHLSRLDGTPAALAGSPPAFTA